MYPEVEVLRVLSPTRPTQAQEPRARCTVCVWGGGVPSSPTPRWIEVVAWRTRGSDLRGRTRGHGSPRDFISELLRSVSLG